jgi:hypothetical protein
MRSGWILLALALAACAAQPEPPMALVECNETPSGGHECVEFEV